MIGSGTPVRIVDALQLGKGVSKQFSDTPGLDSQVLLAHLTGYLRSWILAHPEAQFPKGLESSLSDALTQLKSGVPLPYVLGEWEFYNHKFKLTPAVLIPRPETEILVEAAIRWLDTRPESRRVADIGTGSGCIAISLGIKFPNLRLMATEISPPALAIARINAANHSVADKITFVRADILEPVGGGSFPVPLEGFDMITANLPYIPTEKFQGLDVYKREPRFALDGGPDGLVLIRRLLESAPQALNPGGMLLLEIEAAQGKNAIELAQAHFPGTEVNLHPDLSGRDRLLRIQT